MLHNQQLYKGCLHTLAVNKNVVCISLKLITISSSYWIFTEFIVRDKDCT